MTYRFVTRPGPLNSNSRTLDVHEFLTKTRYVAFLAARQRHNEVLDSSSPNFNITFLREGNVYVLGSNGAGHRVNSISKLDEILLKGTVQPEASSVVVKDSTAVSKEAAGPSRVRRADVEEVVFSFCFAHFMPWFLVMYDLLYFIKRTVDN